MWSVMCHAARGVVLDPLKKNPKEEAPTGDGERSNTIPRAVECGHNRLTKGSCALLHNDGCIDPWYYSTSHFADMVHLVWCVQVGHVLILDVILCG